MTEEGRGANSGTFTCEIDWHQDQTQAGRRQTAICHMSEWTSSSSSRGGHVRLIREYLLLKVKEERRIQSK